MERFIVYFDDPGHALQQIGPMAGADAASAHWILVACPPRLARHAGRWLSRHAREAWRERWAEQAHAAVVPALRARGHRVTPLLASLPLTAQTRELVTRHGAARVLDARRHRVGQDLAPVTHDQPAGQDSRWAVGGAVAGMGAVLVLAAE